MFVKDIVIQSDSKGQVEANLERWRYTLLRRETKVIRARQSTCARTRGKAAERCSCMQDVEVLHRSTKEEQTATVLLELTKVDVF